MIRISIPFLFMIYDSSSIPISDFCICSYFRIFHIFTNLLYTKNLTNLTNLTILQILQPYNLFVDECRTMCRHISYDLLTPGVAAAPRYGRAEIQLCRGTSGSQSSVAAAQSTSLHSRPHNNPCVTKYEEALGHTMLRPRAFIMSVAYSSGASSTG